ncbi:hypothetical protein ACMT4L_17105 [Deinococcus sp. A31D244]|uniref:hypothetical protein n=1 Tax=Deinococcus sp. A31D244 TaxID=3397675 RepID=UPI0039DF7C2B
MIKLDMRALTNAIVKLEAAADALPQIAEQVRQETLGHLIVGSEVNIYRTEPGRYRRTGEYRQGLDARARATRNTATITALNETDYALAVEVGHGGMTIPMLQQLALLRTNPDDPLTLGRSGQNWTVAAPIVTAAQVFALRRMQELFARKVQAALR